MLNLIKTPIGRLRIVGFMEGLSLIFLVFIAVPFKYLGDIPTYVKVAGPIHGLLFCLFVINTFNVATLHSWKFSKITWKVLLACLIPFGTFYIDRYILLPLLRGEMKKNNMRE